MKYKKKKIIITGGGGILGSYLLERLEKEKGIKILVLDKNFKTDQKNRTNVKFLKCDIANDDISMLLKDTDYIFHLACIKPRDYDISIGECLENIKMTMNIAEYNQRAKVIYASGGNVYGNPERIPVNEKDRVQPTELYGLSKVCSEMVLEGISRKRKWQLVILRITNIYGPGFQRQSGALFNFFNKLSNNKPIEIYGNGRQRRDRVWVDDIAEAFILVMKTKVSGIFNIGSGESYSTLEVAKLIGKLLNKKSKIIFKEGIGTEKKDLLLNIKKARKILNYKPKTNFKKGLKLLIDSWCLKL